MQLKIPNISPCVVGGSNLKATRFIMNKCIKLRLSLPGIQQVFVLIIQLVEVVRQHSE